MDEQLLRAALERGAEVGVRLLVAAVVFAAFAVLGRLLRPLVRRRLARRRRPSFARVFSGLVTTTITIVGSLIGATIAFPSVEVADILASLGILSVAVGFAFKDVLENLLAGVLLILRDPFQSGDEIRVAGLEGTVEGITVRETLLRTFDGRRVLIPNARVFTSEIHVQTHFPQVRSTVEVEVDLSADGPEVRRLLCEAVAAVEGVHAEPPAAVLAAGFGQGMRLECRYWTDSPQRAISGTRDRVVEAVRRTLVEAEVPLPVPDLRIETDPRSPPPG